MNSHDSARRQPIRSATVRTTRCFVVLGLLALATLAACGGGGGGNNAPDAGVDAATAPPGWTCEPRDYGDGVVCHCACGIPDPDCATPGSIVSGCVNDQICTPEGTCTDCGDGAVDDGEECDSALDTKAECGPLGYQPGQVPCKATCRWAYDQCMPLPTCANGKLDPVELCDGTLFQPGLDCADYSRTSGTLACKAGCTVDSSGCYTCGDGRREGPEACDDFDTTGNDGCSATCTVESGWQCAASSPSVCLPICGDGLMIGGETCDDGNASPNDGCSATCRIEQDCTCTDAPSTCRCATTQTIDTKTNYVYFTTASLALDGNRQPHATYFYGISYTDPVTGYSMEHGHLIYAQRPATTWMLSEVQAWDQIQAGLDSSAHVLAYDGGTLRAFYHRVYNPNGTFAVATRSGTAWAFTYDNPYYVYDGIRGGSDWHAIVRPTNFTEMHYYAGAPGAWTRAEPLPAGAASGYVMRLGHASNGDVYLATFDRSFNYTSYNMKLTKRVGASTWSTVYDATTTAPAGSCVFPVSHEPLALPNGEMMAFEDGFNGAQQRWLRAHRQSGGVWVVEDVADLGGLNPVCNGGSASYTLLRAATAVDPLGRPHILFATPAVNYTSTTLEDHYRDATGWRVRTFPLTNGTVLDAEIDANGATHILATSRGTDFGTSRLVYIRIDANAW